MIDFALLRHEIDNLKASRNDLLQRINEDTRLLAIELAERRRMPWLEDVSSLYETAIAQARYDLIVTDMRIEALERKLPCQEFIDRFGLDAYRAYLEKYPVNRDTQLVNVRTSYPVWYYQIPREIPVADLSSPPPIRKLDDRGEARFERWMWRDLRLSEMELAYAPEINTVFVNQK